MNYQRIYNELIANRQNNPLPKETYTEKHHIIPKSHGGSNYKINLVALSAREHFIAHWLLWRIHRDSSMAFAFNSMRISDVDKRYKNSFGFEEARKVSAYYNSIRRKGQKHSQETIDRISLSNIGKKCSEETRAKISNAHKGKKASASAKLAMSKSRLGVSKPQQKVACPHCGKIGAKNQMVTYHFNNCKTLPENKHIIRTMGDKQRKQHSEFMTGKSFHFDKTLYTFQHEDGTVRVDIQRNMAKEFGNHINSIIRGSRPTCKGWSFIK